MTKPTTKNEKILKPLPTDRFHYYNQKYKLHEAKSQNNIEKFKMQNFTFTKTKLKVKKNREKKSNKNPKKIEKNRKK